MISDLAITVLAVKWWYRSPPNSSELFEGQEQNEPQADVCRMVAQNATNVRIHCVFSLLVLNVHMFP